MRVLLPGDRGDALASWFESTTRCAVLARGRLSGRQASQPVAARQPPSGRASRGVHLPNESTSESPSESERPPECPLSGVFLCGEARPTGGCEGLPARSPRTPQVLCPVPGICRTRRGGGLPETARSPRTHLTGAVRGLRSAERFELSCSSPSRGPGRSRRRRSS